jgi:hypothetical protein
MPATETPDNSRDANAGKPTEVAGPRFTLLSDSQPHATKLEDTLHQQFTVSILAKKPSKLDCRVKDDSCLPVRRISGFQIDDVPLPFAMVGLTDRPAS